MLEEIFGRDPELLRLDRLLDDAATGPVALAVTGAAGAGKTTLFDEAVDRAVARGFRVLRARPSQAELPLAFAGLADLVERSLAEVRADLPPPQRRAVDVALLVEEAPAFPPEPRVIAAAFRTVLVALARSAPVLVAIDDVQWLDAPTASAVAFAFRRAEHEPVGLLCMQRSSGLPLDLGRAPLPADELPLGGLSLGALHRLLRTRLDVSFSHLTLRRIEVESGGNPFIALEIGRALKRRGINRLGAGAMPVPETLADLVDERLRELSPPVIDALRIVAALTDATLDRALAAGVDGEDLDTAIASGVLVCEGQSLRFSHPLLSAAVVAETPPSAARRVHRLLADTASRREGRVRHLALAADGPSAETANELDAAAVAAEARGAPETAAELFEMAASLTPPDRQDAALRRRLRAGRALAQAGETRAAVAVFEEVIASSPAGPDRADALAQLGWYREDDFEASTRVLEQALEEVGDDPDRRAEIHLFLSDIWAIRGNVPKARAETQLALADARRGCDRPLLASALGQAFWFDWMCGDDADLEQLDEALALEVTAKGARLRSPPSHLAGLYQMSVGQLDEARASFERTLRRADADGEEYWRVEALLRTGVVEALAGRLQTAEQRVHEALEIAEQLDLLQIQSAILCGCGTVALWRGRQDGARNLARRGLALSERTGDEVYVLCHTALLGSVDLACGRHAAAADLLEPLVARLPAIGRRPNTQFVAADAVEALAGAARVADARAALEAVEPRGRDPIAALLAERSRGHIAAADADVDAAVRHFTQAETLHAGLPLPLEHGRTLLALGGALRRRKQRRAAREALLEALGLFDAAGAGIWSRRVRTEIGSVSGRAPGDGELTVTERRVAELVAEGLSNREVAARLVVTVRAVESILTKVYTKLGVRSRTQMAGLLRDGADSH